MKKKNNNGNKVSTKHFLSMQIKILKELFAFQRLQTLGIILLSIIMVIPSLIEIKLLEYLTNSVQLYVNNDRTEDFVYILLITVSFLCMLLVFKLLSNLNGIIVQNYSSSISKIVDKRFVKKLSMIPYEYYESASFYDKINMASKASNEYSNAIWGITELVR